METSLINKCSIVFITYYTFIFASVFLYLILFFLHFILFYILNFSSHIEIFKVIVFSSQLLLLFLSFSITLYSFIHLFCLLVDPLLIIHLVLSDKPFPFQSLSLLFLFSLFLLLLLWAHVAIIWRCRIRWKLLIWIK
jgi:hypothetical protein